MKNLNWFQKRKKGFVTKEFDYSSQSGRDHEGFDIDGLDNCDSYIFLSDLFEAQHLGTWQWALHKP